MSLRRPLRRTTSSSATWVNAVERYRRAVDRYYSNLTLMPDRALRQELTHLGAPLDRVLQDFQEVLARRADLDKAREAEILAAIHRGATLCAHATEAALLANEAAWRHAEHEVAQRLDRVFDLVRTIDAIGDQVRPGP